jgi:hypothetical protein
MICTIARPIAKPPPGGPKNADWPENKPVWKKKSGLLPPGNKAFTSANKPNKPAN